MTTYMPIKDRFLAKVEKTDHCWNWTGATYFPPSLPYGRFTLFGTTMPAHRAAYKLFCGQISESVLICHHCDNPRCVNPDHLYAGTVSDNNQDTVRRGRRNPSPIRNTENALRGEANNLSVLSADQVIGIRKRSSEGETAPKIAASIGVNPETIRRIVARKTWSHLP